MKRYEKRKPIDLLSVGLTTFLRGSRTLDLDLLKHLVTVERLGLVSRVVRLFCL